MDQNLYTKIKICGITRDSDAQAAVSAGADAIGFVFHPPSPRYIEPDRASIIARGLPPFVSRVGVMVDPSVDYVRRLLESVELDYLQLQGDEDEAFCLGLRHPYIKGIRIRDMDEVGSELQRFPSARALLLDTYVEGEPGGTGKPFPWKKPPDTKMPIILAGGLDSENVARAIKLVSPYGVDVSSGVEVDKGIKDTDKIKTFIRNVRNAFD